jgi:hypothetical protein
VDVFFYHNVCVYYVTNMQIYISSNVSQYVVRWGSGKYLTWTVRPRRAAALVCRVQEFVKFSCDISTRAHYSQLKYQIQNIYRIELYANFCKVRLIHAVAAQLKAWACGRSLAGIVGSNPPGGMHVCLLWALCVVAERSLRRVDVTSRGVLPTVVRLSVIVKPR